jgi:uncharacterized membrane protein
MKRSPRAAEPEIPPRDWWVALLSAVGLLVAGYLTVNKWSGGTALFCTAGSGCDIVQASRYAVFLGLPTAAWGAGLYATVGALALLGLPPRRWLAAFLLAVAGASFSLYLTSLSIFEIGATCAYCLASAGIALALFGLLLWRRPPVPGRRSPVRLARVAALGALTAVATVVLGAGVFATLDPKEAAIYQEALARHLKASGAVMYGAYW